MGLTSILMKQAPEAMTNLLDMVDGMKKLDMTPVKNGLGKVRDNICELKPEMVSEPVKKFAEAAQEQVNSLDDMVSKAKAAKNAGGMVSAAKDALKAVPGVGSLF